MDQKATIPFNWSSRSVFISLFVLTAVLYIPAAKAGWVIDGAGFIFNLRHQGFWDFINRNLSDDKSFYQVLTLQYYIGYKLWGMNVWMWSLLYLSLHATNAWLLFRLCRRLLGDSRVTSGALIAFSGSILFTLSPYISEVIICKAYYHYLQSFLFILLILLWVIQYQHHQEKKYVYWSGILFFLAAFTLEIFYLIPILVFVIASYYHYALGYSKSVYRKTLGWFVLVQVIMLGLYFVALRARYGGFGAHKIGYEHSLIWYLSKPPKYLFHLLLLGRFFSTEIKNRVYDLSETLKILVPFYSLIALWLIYVLTRLRKISGEVKSMALLLILTLITLAFVSPLPFPDASLLVFYDRYTYFTCGFLYTLMALMAFRYGNRYIAMSLLFTFGLVSLFFTARVNTWWKQSAYINNHLIYSLPPAGDKTIILLNVPENMYGVPMIGAQPLSKYRDIFEIFRDSIIRNPIFDAASYNMLTMNDGAHVMVMNDSTIHVTLNQWGTWWWYEGHGARSYGNDYYRVNMVDAGHWYELTLKYPASGYLLLYEVGPNWKIVDMNRRNTDQN